MPRANTPATQRANRLVVTLEPSSVQRPCRPALLTVGGRIAGGRATVAVHFFALGVMSSEADHHDLDLPSRTLQDGRGAGCRPSLRSHAGRGTRQDEQDGVTLEPARACRHPKHHLSARLTITRIGRWRFRAGYLHFMAAHVEGAWISKRRRRRNHDSLARSIPDSSIVTSFVSRSSADHPDAYRRYMSPRTGFATFFARTTVRGERITRLAHRRRSRGHRNFTTRAAPRIRCRHRAPSFRYPGVTTRRTAHFERATTRGPGIGPPSEEYFTSDNQLVTLRAFANPNRRLGVRGAWAEDSRGRNFIRAGEAFAKENCWDRISLQSMPAADRCAWAPGPRDGLHVRLHTAPPHSTTRQRRSSGVGGSRGARFRRAAGFSIDTRLPQHDISGRCVRLFFVPRALAPIAGSQDPEPCAVTVRQVLQCATVNGARCAALLDKCGTLTPGKEADVVMIRADEMNVYPLNNALGTVVQAAEVHNVDTVIIGGAIRKRHGALVGVNMPVSTACRRVARLLSPR